MQKILIAIVIVAVLLVAGFYAFNSYIYNEKQAVTVPDYKDAEFIIGAERVKLADGVIEIETAPTGGVSKTIYRYFGNEVKADLNEDGIPDLAFLLTQDTGGSGTFYYLVAAIQSADNRYQGSVATLIGDRIAPQTTEFRDGLVIVNYADRAPGAPMTEAPSVGKSVYMKYDPAGMMFGEVVQDFEGETDAVRITAKVNQGAIALGVNVIPREVISDSRCPIDVTCVWAGTVIVRATLESLPAATSAAQAGDLGTAEQIFERGVPVTTEAHIITLDAVEPAPREGVSIHSRDYLFHFLVKKH